MSSEIEKLVNRFKESQGKKFKKIPQELIQREEELELINGEIAEAKKEKASDLTIQKLEGQKLAVMRTIQGLRKKVKEA